MNLNKNNYCMTISLVKVCTVFTKMSLREGNYPRFLLSLPPYCSSYYQGWCQEFSDGGADSSDEGAKIWFSGCYKCQKSPKKLLFTFPWGLACSDEGVIAP